MPSTPSSRSNAMIRHRRQDDDNVNTLLRTRNRQGMDTKAPMARNQNELEDLKREISDLTQDLQNSIADGNEDKAGQYAVQLATLTKKLRGHTKRHRDLLDMVGNMQLQLDRVRVDLTAECGRFKDIQSVMAPMDENELRLRHEIEDGRVHVFRLKDELKSFPKDMAKYEELETMFSQEYLDLVKANDVVLNAYEFAGNTLDSLSKLKEMRLDD